MKLPVWDPESASVRDADVGVRAPGEQCRLRLRGLPGASAIALALSDDQGQALFEGELGCAGEESAEIQVARLEDGSLRLDAGRRALFAFEGARHPRTPPGPLVPRLDTPKVDVAIVVDGTARRFENGAAPPPDHADEGFLLGDPGGAWSAHIAELVELVRTVVSPYPEARFTCFAFGDHPLAGINAPELQPGYVLDPAERHERALRPFSHEALRTMLGRLRSTSGGDLVDALGDALQAATQVGWDPLARKILILTGDSPGHSIVAPPPFWEASARPRRWDVETQADELFALGVEVVTIFHDPEEQSVLRDKAHGEALIRYVEEQYATLASTPALAARRRNLDVNALSRALLDDAAPVGRGAVVGILESVEMLPPAGGAGELATTSALAPAGPRPEGAPKPDEEASRDVEP